MPPNKPSTERILRQKNYELLAEALQARIVDGELRSGDEVPPERVLMEDYGVGRSSVREALRILESRGLIVQHRNGFGVADFANPLGESMRFAVSLNGLSAVQLFEVRESIEVAMAGYAAERRTDADLQRMRSAVDAMHASHGDRDRHIDAELSFHMIVARASANPLYEHVMAAIRDVLRRALHETYLIAPTADEAVAGHREILAAIEAGRAEEARAAMADQLAGVGQALAGGRSPVVP